MQMNAMKCVQQSLEHYTLLIPLQFTVGAVVLMNAMKCSECVACLLVNIALRVML